MPSADLGPQARALFVAERGALRPNSADRRRVALALCAQLGEAAFPSWAHATGAAPAAAAASHWFGWTGLGAVLAGIVVTGGVAFSALRTSDAKPQAPVVASAAVTAPTRDAVPNAPVSPTVVDVPTPLDTTEPSRVVRRAPDRLAEEVEILSRAETELHAGHHRAALRVLEEYERKFSGGKLAQERTAARILALCGLGRTSEANAALARMSPRSLHAGVAREACATTAAQ